MSKLWDNMWSEHSFVPAGTDEEATKVSSEERIEKLEHRVRVLENRLNRLSGI